MENFSLVRKGNFYAILSGLMYSLLGYFGMSMIREGYSVSGMSFWRFLSASLFILVLIIPKIGRYKVDIKDVAFTLLLGSVFYGGCAITYFYAAEYIGTGLSIVIFFTFPAYVLLINKFLYGARITKNYIIAIGLIMLGLICLVDLKEATVDIIGILISLLSGVLYAGYVAGGKSIRMAPLLSSFLACISCTITALVFALHGGTLAMPTETHIWMDILGIGIISTAIPMILLLEALKYISSAKVAILSVLEPVFMVIFGIILLDEHITILQGIGVIIILSGSLVTLISPGTVSSINVTLRKKLKR